jgi:hypothetical protein
MLTGNALNTATPILQDPLIANTVLAQNDMKPNNAIAWKIKSIHFENPITSGSNLYRFTVVLITEKNQNITFGPNIGRRVVGDVYCFVQSGVITTCTGGVDPIAQAKQQCGALGGSWTDTNPYGTQCVFRQVASIPPIQPIVPTPVFPKDDDGKDKGDHNNDGHPDNGKGSDNSNQPCDRK